VANLGHPVVALVIVYSPHNSSLEWKVHEVNVKTNAVRPRLFRYARNDKSEKEVHKQASLAT
jgi:hypothetical protein